MTNLQRWREYLRDLESPDLFIDWAFYSMISAALQRRVWYYDEAFALYPNLFTFLVGPPATGKSRVISQVGLIFKGAGMRWMNPNTNPAQEEDRFPLGADRITKEKLALELAKVPKIIFRENSKGIRVPYLSSPRYFILEELGTLLGKNAEDIVNVLNQLYDSRDYTAQTKGQGDDYVKNVCVSILAGTTPNAIQKSFSDEVMSQGFTSRIILVHAPGPRFWREFPGLDDGQKEHIKAITDHVKLLHDKPVFGQVRLSPEAEEFHKELYESGKLYNERLNTDFRLDDYYGRKKVHWLKLAMAIHFADNTDNTIQLSSLVAALDVLNATEPTMHRCYTSAGVNSPMALAESVYRRVHQEGETGLSFSKLLMHFYVSNTPKDMLMSTLELLVTTGRVKANRIIATNDVCYVAVEWDKPFNKGTMYDF